MALLAPLFWAGSNIFDKYALEKVSRGVYDFLFFGTMGSILIATLTFFVFGLDEVSVFILYPLVAGFLVQASYLFYSHALQKEDASYIVPLYITYTVVVLIIGPFFGETVSLIQFLAFMVVFLGALVISLKELSFKLFSHRKGALLMIPATILIGLAVLLTDQSLEILSFSDTFIYDLIGFSIAGFCLLLVPRWRKEILKGIKTANAKKYSLFLVNDTLDMSGHLIYKYALLLAPSAGLVAVLGGIQPFYVLSLGIFLTIFFPKVIKENISKKEISQKVVGATIIFVGILILSLS
ncbi:MAG: drug/metabolite transporter (DMT)-like permease [Candidatus Paceibacteria bacterium]|jgi:drug/metabolite transporter (DMT)-like permease